MGKLPEDDHHVAGAGQVGGTHYKKRLDPWTIIDALGLDFYEGNALKYLLRYKEKDGIRDLEKLKHYADKLILRLRNNVPEHSARPRRRSPGR